MNQRKRRSTYQYGTLVLEKRSRGPNVWAYRYFEIENGKKRRRKSIVGTQDEYPPAVRQNAQPSICDSLPTRKSATGNAQRCAV